jgi:hypothetical protein
MCSYNALQVHGLNLLPKDFARKASKKDNTVGKGPEAIANLLEDVLKISLVIGDSGTIRKALEVGAEQSQSAACVHAQHVQQLRLSLHTCCSMGRSDAHIC